MHVSTYTECLVKIGLAVVEIFGGICRFLPSRPKRCSCYPSYLWGYWTDLDHIRTHRSYNIVNILNQNCHIPTRFRMPACRIKAILPILPKIGLVAKIAMFRDVSVPNDRRSSNSGRVAAKIPQTPFLNFEVTGPMFTNVAQLSPRDLLKAT